MHAFLTTKPRLAFTISILIVIAGLISFNRIPVNLLPDIKKPMVKIKTSYPSANAKVLENSFIQPVEDALNGVKGMDYIRSFSTNDGFAMIRVVFNAGTDPDQNEINVQNRLSTVIPRLPAAIQANGITVNSSSSTKILVISLYSSDNSMSPLQLNDYANRFIIRPLTRLPGVSEVKVSDTMSIKVSLDLHKMQALGVTIDQVSKSIREQNQAVAAGYISAAPAHADQQFTFPIQADGLLSSLAEIKKVIVRAKPDGGTVYLEDIARIAPASQNAEIGEAILNGKSTAFITVYQRTDASTVPVADAVKNTLNKLSEYFPASIGTQIIIDQSQFIQVSINEVLKTLLETTMLVILVVFLFLQNWRTTLIPAAAIPVSLIGTLTFMAMLGYSINTVSLFALVVSIGIVVDDAIIVIENVERHMSQHNLHPREATIRAMKEISGPVLTTTLVLLSVFISVAFLPGIQGKILKQFSLVLSISVSISSLVALTLSPALCTTLLRTHVNTPAMMQPVASFINKLTSGYIKTVAQLLKYNKPILLLLLMIMAGAFIIFRYLPTGFIPDEDQGNLKIYMQLPQGVSASKVNELGQYATNIIERQPGVKNVAIIPENDAEGSSLEGFIQLKPWSQRTKTSESIEAVIKNLQRELNELPDARVLIYNPPLIGGKSMGKLNLHIQSTDGQSLEALAKVAESFAKEAEKCPQIGKIISNFETDVPVFKLNIDRNKARTLGISMQDISKNLQTLDPVTASRFNIHQRQYDIQLQTDRQFRQHPGNLHDFYLISDKSHKKQIPLSTVATLSQVPGASWISHYNLYRAAKVDGQPAPGYSASEAIQALTALLARLPEGYKYTWSGQTLEQINANKTLFWLFPLSALFIYLFLVALYESWLLPLAVMVIVPTAIFGACFLLLILQMENNIYTQIGLLLLIGMSAKSTILMTEFSIKARGSGASIREAAFAAAKLRFRPVLMTSLAFILGIIPLLFATGPGANSRLYLGITIISGMMVATLIGTLIAPSTYTIAQQLREKIHGEKAAKLPESS